MIDKIVNFAKDFRVMYVAILGVIPIGIWAADTVFQTDQEAKSNIIILLEFERQRITPNLASLNDEKREDARVQIEIIKSQINQIKEGL